MRFSFFFFLLSSHFILAQNAPIVLNNAGFEDIPKLSKAPRGWYDCGAASESPPDIHPIDDSAFGVDKAAREGTTYLGLVVRDNNTVEAIGQRLKTPLKAQECYEFKIALCQSSTYISQSPTSGEKVNFDRPVTFRLWGGNNYCEKKEMLVKAGAIKNTNWQTYILRFTPTEGFTYLMIEAFYSTPKGTPYNGNLLLDQLSTIGPCTDEPTTSPKPPKSATKITSSQPQSSSSPSSSLSGVKKENLREGQSIPINQLFFEADKAEISPNSYPVLEELYHFLNQYQKVAIEIGGHTNSTPPDWYCDSLSSARAKAVMEFLIQKGIAKNRLSYKGYGKRKPITSNRTPAGRRRNQRVEVKVLQLRMEN